MKHTERQSTHQTLLDLFRSLDRRHAVTITVFTQDKDDNGRKVYDRDPATGKRIPRLSIGVRTIEIITLGTTADGDIFIDAMDRDAQEIRRFLLSRVVTYTCHRSAYQVPVPEDTTRVTPVFIPRSEKQYVAYELGRDDRNKLRARSAHALAA